MPFPHLTVTQNCTEKNVVIVSLLHTPEHRVAMSITPFTQKHTLFTNMEGDKDTSDTEGRTQGKNMHMDSD